MAKGPDHTVVRSTTRTPVRAGSGAAAPRAAPGGTGARSGRGRPPAVVLTEARGQSVQGPPALAEAAGRSRKIDRTGTGIVGVHPEPALRQVLGLEHLGRRVHAGQGPPAPLGRGRRLRPGPRQQPRVQRRVHGLLGLAPFEGVGTGEGLSQRVVVEHVEELAELLGRRHQGDVAVRTGVHPARDERLAGRIHESRSRRAVAVLVCEQRGGPRRKAREHLEGGAVDEGTGTGRLGADDGGQRAQGRHVAHQVQREMTGQPDRTVVGTGAHQGIAHGLDDDVVPFVPRVGTGGTEAADAHDRERRPELVQDAPGHPPGVRPAASGLLDHQVRAAQKILQPGSAAGCLPFDDRAALVRVEVQEGATPERPVGTPGGAPPVAQVVTRGRLHLDHVGPQIGEQLPAVAPRDPPGQLHDVDPAQQLPHRCRSFDRCPEGSTSRTAAPSDAS